MIKSLSSNKSLLERSILINAISSHIPVSPFRGRNTNVNLDCIFDLEIRTIDSWQTLFASVLAVFAIKIMSLEM